MENSYQLSIVELIGLDSSYNASQVIVNGSPVNGKALDVLSQIAKSGSRLVSHSVISMGHEKYIFQ